MKQTEVVLAILEEATAAVAAAGSSEKPSTSVEPSQKPHKSPEMGISKSSRSPRKPQRPPHRDTLRRRPSVSGPAFAESMSRLVEHPPPTSPKPANPQTQNDHPSGPSSPFHGSPTPKIPPVAEVDEEEYSYRATSEDEDVDQRIQRQQRRVRVRTQIQWPILVLTVGCLAASLTVRRLQSFIFLSLEIWRWCLMGAVICCGQLFSQWFTNILVFLIERNFLLRKKVLYYHHGFKKSAQVYIWLALVFLAWSLVFNRGVHRSPKTVILQHYVSRILALLLIGSVIWLVKTTLVKILASFINGERFFRRIQESIFHQYVLQMLSGPPLMDLAEKVGRTTSNGQLSFRSMGSEKDKRKGGEVYQVIDMSKLHRIRPEKVSARKMKLLISVIKKSRLTTISNTMDDRNDQEDREITSEWEAKNAAMRIFKNVANPGCEYIDEGDLLRFLSKEEVHIVLPMFEGVWETGKITKSALHNFVVKAYFDRKSLAHSLNDSKAAVKQLHKLATATVIIVITVITLLVMGFATTRVIVVISSQVLLAAFMFGNTCKTAFESIIFLFVIHAFDVGDRCVIDGVQMIVEEMNILTTVFLGDNNEKIRYPNSVLVNKPITNYYRSPDMNDSVSFSVDVKASMEFIGVLRARIKVYIESKPNHWCPTHSIVVKDIVDVNKMNMALNVTHTMNYQNIAEKNSRRTDLALEVKKILEGLSIHYSSLP